MMLYLSTSLNLTEKVHEVEESFPRSGLYKLNIDSSTTQMFFLDKAELKELDLDVIHFPLSEP